MSETREIIVNPKEIAEVEDLNKWLSEKLQRPYLRVLKKSLDARKKPIVYRVRYEFDNQPLPPQVDKIAYQKVHNSNQSCVIIGFGPAGIFAALKCLELGIKPIVIERGKQVRERRRDLAKITKLHEVNPDSNYCFGEGGAGTYSDGKLYTRSTKRGNVRRIFSVFTEHGAPSHILYEAHPHIGTNKLPGIIESMRECILDHGGEIKFNTRFDNLLIENQKLTGIQTNQGVIKAKAVILATGHSARNVYNSLLSFGLTLENKAFAVGFRIEHLQEFINKCQYKGVEAFLPPAAYSLVEKLGENAVFSFCMCPGGIIAPCATENGEIVTNGWSPSKRNNKWANSGIVTQVHPEELKTLGFEGPLAGVNFQKSIEQQAGKWAEGSQKAPAQYANDYLNGKKSTGFPETSYLPGLVSADLNHLFPKKINQRLKKGLRAFDKKIKGFLASNPIIVGPETRTSAPLRIPRDLNLMHPELPGLFPCGEGAGFAGGIASAAIDGERCADGVAQYLGMENLSS